MNRKDIEEKYPDVPFLFADGFDKAIIGVSRTFNKISVAYDMNKCIRILMDRHEITQLEAIEDFEYNTIGSNVGKYTPTFIIK
tara:strand:- start:1371 stop:1619 length:249 start_codon:yes stop_codon:yes gene_type:complete